MTFTVLGNGYFRDVVEKEALGFVEVCSSDEHIRRTRQRSGWDVRRSFTEGGRNLLEGHAEGFTRPSPPITCQVKRWFAAAGMMFGAPHRPGEARPAPWPPSHLSPLCFRSVYDRLLWPRWALLPLRHALFWLIERGIDPALRGADQRLSVPAGAAAGLANPLGRGGNSPQLVLGLFPRLAVPAAEGFGRPNSVLPGCPLYDSLQPFTAQRDPR